MGTNEKYLREANLCKTKVDPMSVMTIYRRYSLKPLKADHNPFEDNSILHFNKIDQVSHKHQPASQVVTIPTQS